MTYTLIVQRIFLWIIILCAATLRAGATLAFLLFLLLRVDDVDNHLQKLVELNSRAKRIHLAAQILLPNWIVRVETDAFDAFGQCHTRCTVELGPLG